MQIHELGKQYTIEGLLDKIKTGVQTLASQPGAGRALGQAVTPGYNHQGATDTGEFTQSKWMDLYRNTKMNQATQAWIDGLLRQWKIHAAKLPQNLTAKSAPATTTAPAGATSASCSRRAPTRSGASSC